MFDHKHYVPVLVPKRGERHALRDLDGAHKQEMTPLLVVAPVDWDFDAGEPSKTLDRHLSSLAKELSQCWGVGRAFVDLLYIDGSALMADGSHPLVWLTADANNFGLPLVPVTGIDRDPSYIHAVADVVARDGRGACIRLFADEWPTSTGTAALDTLLKDLGVQPADVDLVLDLGDQVVAAPALSLTAVRAELIALPYLHDWRSLTVTGAAFPKGMSEVDKGWNEVPRHDWHLYVRLVNGPPLPRTPTFGDYAVAHPDPTVDVDPRIMLISAGLRYTTDDVWLVPKGELFKGRGGSGLGGAAVPPLANEIVTDHRFAGRSHCSGDVWLDDVVSGAASGGNPEAWRRIGTTHHLSHVTGQLAILHGPSAGSAPPAATL